MKTFMKLSVLGVSTFLLCGLGLTNNSNKIETHADTGSTYNLVTSVSDLEIGTTYAIGSVKTGSGVFASTESNSNNRKQTEAITVASSAFTSIETLEEFTLAKSTITDFTDYYTFYGTKYLGTKGYLNCTSTASNYLKVVAAEDKYAAFSITFDETEGNAIVTCKGKDTNNLMRYNSGNSIFACYSSGQKEIYLYKVVGKTLTSISVGDTTPTKTSYYKEETFDPTGLTVTATYSDTSTANVTSSTIWTPSPLTTGTTLVVGTYTFGGVAKTVSISIPAVQDRTISSINIVTKPTKLAYYVGDSLDLTGIVIKAQWNAGDDTDVTKDCVITPEDGYVFVDGDAPSKTIGVAYNTTYTTSFDVSVTKYDYRSLLVEKDVEGFTDETAETADTLIYQNAVVGGISWDAICTPNEGAKARIAKNVNAPTGLQFGASGNIAKTGLLRSQPFVASNGVNGIKMIVLNAGGGAGSSAGNIEVKVGDTPLTCADNTFSGNSVQDYIFVSSTPLLGRIEITITNTALLSSSSMKIHNIIVTGSETLTTDAAKANDFAAKVELANTCGDNASLISEYDGLSTEVKALVDAITVYDFATSQRTGGRTVSVTCGAKMTLIKALATTGGTTNNTNRSSMSTNVAIIISVAVAILGLTSTGVILALKRKKDTF